MSRRVRYSIVYSEDALMHVLRIDHRHLTLIRKTLLEQLSFQPDIRTRNRKPFERLTDIAADVWELRFGQGNMFRALYHIDKDAQLVQVLAVLTKVGNRYYAGNEEYEL